ncbi:MAG TPA: NAD-dependent epimerase/dehydratase family protein [Cyclobacteriaceae bacterium]|nr:NAD-dependent epimerase/dehydratase family protein [Cyclobacteriaceae bacterium]
MSSTRTALIAGASGLIGSFLLHELLNSKHYTKIIVLSRKPLNIADESVQEIITDPATLAQHADELMADDVFCCLGTTMAKARSKEKFYEVDFTYPYELAKICKQNGAHQYLLVSAMGADKRSMVYYNRVKGEVEEAIRDVQFEGLHIFRPSLLLGPRIEKRAGEDAAKIFYKYLGWLIPRKYKGIEAEKVARAMLYFALQDQKGVFVHESAKLQQY